MISAFYLNSNIQDKSVKLFIESSITNFYDEISNHLNKTDRVFKKYHLIEYGEMAMVNFFINGIVRNDVHNVYTILNEFSIDKIKNQKSGRVDIIIEDTLVNEIYYIEAKIAASNEDAPSTLEWKDKKIVNEGYNKILSQADKYIESDWKNYLHPEWEKYGAHNRNKFYKIAWVFNSVRFENKDKIQSLWNYMPLLENEFYAFQTFSSYEDKNVETDKTNIEILYGLACYGIIQEVVTMF